MFLLFSNSIGSLSVTLTIISYYFILFYFSIFYLLLNFLLYYLLSFFFFIYWSLKQGAFFQACPLVRQPEVVWLSFKPVFGYFSSLWLSLKPSFCACQFLPCGFLSSLTGQKHPPLSLFFLFPPPAPPPPP